MPRSRDRHGRGLRGPLAPDAVDRRSFSRPAARTEFFNECVREAVAEICRFNPRALDGVRVGVEEVPHFNTPWSGERVPLAAALEPTRGRSATVVVYERPLELRARSRSDLRQLVHRTICEQLSALTGLSIQELTDEDWDAL